MSATQAQAAEALGVSERTIRRWRRRGAPFVGEGAGAVVDLEALRAWARAEGLDGSPGRPLGALGVPARAAPPSEQAETADGEPSLFADAESRKAQLERAEVRRREADAARKELELLRQRELLVDVEDVRRAMVARAVAYRAALEALPARVADRLAGLPADAIEELLELEVEQVLERVCAIDLGSSA